MKTKLTRLRHLLPALVFIFSVVLTFIGCKKQPTQPDPARGTLQNQYGECLPNSVRGLWYNGTPLTSSDSGYADINVFVTRAGAYTITTDKVNGVTFSASGNFNDTGLNVVRLKPSGTFINPGAFVFPFTFDSSTCQLNVNVQDSAALLIGDNKWHFTANGHTYSGFCGVDIFDLPQSDAIDWEFTGYLDSNGQDSVLSISFVANGDNFGNDTIPYPCLWTLYTRQSSGKFLYNSDSGPNQPASMYIQVKSTTVQTTPTYKVTRLYSMYGAVRDTANHVVPITNGMFKTVN